MHFNFIHVYTKHAYLCLFVHVLGFINTDMEFHQPTDSTAFSWVLTFANNMSLSHALLRPACHSTCACWSASPAPLD